jgi:hypothetical protein
LEGTTLYDVIVQTVSLLGSLLILGAFVGGQLRKLAPSDLSYVLPNLAGSCLLAVVAMLEKQWGFLLLEGVWALVSLWSAVQHARSAWHGEDG